MIRDQLFLHWRPQTNNWKGDSRGAQSTMISSLFSVCLDSFKSHSVDQIRHLQRLVFFCQGIKPLVPKWRDAGASPNNRLQMCTQVHLATRCYLRQFSSSLLSEQSSSSSHLHRVGMQRPFLHWNCPVSHSDFVLVPMLSEKGKQVVNHFVGPLSVRMWMSGDVI